MEKKIISLFFSFKSLIIHLIPPEKPIRIVCKRNMNEYCSDPQGKKIISIIAPDKDPKNGPQKNPVRNKKIDPIEKDKDISGI